MVASARDVIVIGGGVIGLAIAYRLATRGVRVLLLERGEIGREASWAGAGILEYGSLTRSDPLALLRRASMRRYEPWVQELQRRTRGDVQFVRSGSLDLILDENQAAAARREAQAAANLPESGVRLLSASELRQVAPALSHEFNGALLREQTAQVRNPRLLATLAAACVSLGVELRDHHPVADVHVQHDRIAGVQTLGERFSAEHVVVAAGAWSSQLPSLREGLQVAPVRGQVVLLGPSEPPSGRILMCGKRYLVPRSDGLMLVGSTEEPGAGFDVRPTAGGVRTLLDFVQRAAPGLRHAPIARIWAGLRPAAPDGRPYIGPVAEIAGLYVAAGHFRAGLTLAPVTADIITEQIKGDMTELDVAPFAPGRSFQTDVVASEDAPHCAE